MKCLMVLLSLLVFTGTACKKDKGADGTPDDSKIVLLSKIIYNEHGDSIRYEYDTDNQLRGWKEYHDGEPHCTATVTMYSNTNQPSEIKRAYSNGVKDSTRYFYNADKKITKIDFLQSPAMVTDFTYYPDSVVEKAIQKPSTVFYTRTYLLGSDGNFTGIKNKDASGTSIWELTGFDNRKNYFASDQLAFWAYSFYNTDGIIPISPVSNYSGLKISRNGTIQIELILHHQYDGVYLKKTDFERVGENKPFTMQYEYLLK